MHYHPILIVSLALFMTTFSYSAHAADFCVADLTGPATASGYACKNPKNVTVDDFVFSGFVAAGNTSNANKGSVIRATVDSFPAVNGMSLAAARLDMKADGVIQLHTHRHSSEMIYVVEGTITTGFVSSLPSNTVYVKKLNKGEVMVIPQGLVHFQFNSGTKDAVVLNFFASADPGLQIISPALFGNNFSSFLVEKTTGIGHDEVKRLKALLGGSA